MSEHRSEERAALRIVAGKPTAEDLAVLSVLLTASGTESAPETRQIGGWSDLSLRLRRPLPAGPGAWRSSGRT